MHRSPLLLGKTGPWRTLSEWVKSIKHQLKRRLYIIRSVSTKYISICADWVVSRHLADLYDRFVIVPADKASNNVVLIFKTYLRWGI